MPRAVFGSDHEQHPPHEKLPPTKRASVTATSNFIGTRFLVKESPLCRSDAWYSKMKFELAPSNCSCATPRAMRSVCWRWRSAKL
eukprot:12366849-Heterocapsa_arctica.AAC.1